MAGSAKHTQRTALVQLSQYNGDEHIFSGGMTGGVLTYDAGSGTGWSWKDAIGLNQATPAGAGTIETRMSGNGQTGLRIRRFTDTGPTGNYLVCDNAAGSPLMYITSLGVVNAPNGLVAPVTSLTGTLAVSQGGTGDTGTPWTAYSPTVSAASGTLTSASAIGRYKTLGKTVWVAIHITITTNGTAAGHIVATVPFAANGALYSILAGSEIAVIGAMCKGQISPSGSTVVIVKHDNTYPGGNGHQVILSGLYESA